MPHTGYKRQPQRPIIGPCGKDFSEKLSDTWSPVLYPGGSFTQKALLGKSFDNCADHTQRPLTWHRLWAWPILPERSRHRSSATSPWRSAGPVQQKGSPYASSYSVHSTVQI